MTQGVVCDPPANYAERMNRGRKNIAAVLVAAAALLYGLSPVDRVHAIRLLGSTINGFIALERIGSFDHSQPAPETSWRIALDALDSLLAAWPSTGKNS